MVKARPHPARLSWLLIVPWLVAGQVHTSEINPPIGPHVNLDASDFADTTSFTAEDRVVLTAYFYWYDVYSGAHIYNADGSDALTTHPPTMTGFSYRSKSWHRQQLLDMMDAGIDVLLPVYWGEPSQRLPDEPVLAQPWSYAGLPPLVRAREELLAEGMEPPRIGLFYDTSTLEWNQAGHRIDLTTDYGRQWFYESIRDFFSLIPPRHWAMIDGRPIVFLYSASFAADHDQTCIEYAHHAFAADFAGRTPYIVREISWNVQTDQVYAWGGALGLKNPGVASLGPGYDHSAVPGREPLIVDREDGAFFERNWNRFLRNPSKLVMIETWNEFHEGTDIAASLEYGRQYIELNRHYVDLFKAGFRPPRPRGAWSDFKSVEIQLGVTNNTLGLVQFDHPDGMTEPAVVAELECRSVVPTEHGGRYIYLRIDDSFKWADLMLVDVEVEYYDSAPGQFRIEYDGSDLNAPFQGAYTATPRWITLTGSERWKTARFRLHDARFLNSQNGGADLRIAAGLHPLHVRSVLISRPGLPAEAGARVHGWMDHFDDSFDSNWQVSHPEPSAFRAANGLLEIGSAGSTPARVMATAVNDSTIIEILARMRVIAAPACGWLGGLTVCARTGPDQGLDFQFKTGPNHTREVALGGEGLSDAPRAEFAWETKEWYWLRLRHQPMSVPGSPDLLAKLWRADGETPEPVAWTLHWDYFPAGEPRQGRPGFIAGTVEGGLVECDFFLIRRDDLPLITVILPELKPVRPSLSAPGLSADTRFRVSWQGEPQVLWTVEASNNLRNWEDVASIHSTTGPIHWVDPDSATMAQRFYRVRQGP